MTPLDDASMLAVWLNVLFLLSRYLHIVAAMLLVGGILFYEMVVPYAIANLKETEQMAIFAQARHVFRWIIWACVVLVILSGIYLTVRRVHIYIESQFVLAPTGIFNTASLDWPLRTGYWWAAHVIGAIIAILIALYMFGGDRPPRYPVNWLRLDLMVLLIVIFFATVTHQVDQIHQERILRHVSRLTYPRYLAPAESSESEANAPALSQPATAPAQP